MTSINRPTPELKVSRRTFYRWRGLRIGPAAIKLPNREIRTDF